MVKLEKKIIELLKKRGVETAEDIEEFLSLKPRKTYDPFLLLNMEAGVDLILSAIENNKKICIFGDYDVDGVTSAAILTQVLKVLTDNFFAYLPSRFDDGYGLNCDALERIKAQGAELIITVDCGSSSIKEVEYGKKLGLEFLITDHHTVGEEVPECVFINPKQANCTYPFKGLAGCGVAFKLAQGLVTATGIDRNILTKTLDLVGIGTIGDIVPLVDENRTLAKYGIRAINVSNRPGLVNLIHRMGLELGSITSEVISFGIVPSLNAAGRMERAKIAYDILVADSDSQELRDSVDRLIQCNDRRRCVQEDIFDKCREIVDSKLHDREFLVIYLGEAHEGVTGIVAGKIKDRYNKPTIILTDSINGEIKGTGRCIDGINLFNLLNKNKELFTKYGGHAAACGFSMRSENMKTLERNLNKSMVEIVSENPMVVDTRISEDIALMAEDVNTSLVEQLSLLAPFGCENHKPLVKLEGIPVSPRKMGSNGQYRKFMLRTLDGREFQTLLFKDADKYDSVLEKNCKIDIIGTLGTKIWKDKEYLQITAIDIGEK